MRTITEIILHCSATPQGNPLDTRTPEQRDMLWSLVKSLKKRFPGATVHGHNEFAAKACPCFDVRKEFTNQ